MGTASSPEQSHPSCLLDSELGEDPASIGKGYILFRHLEEMTLLDESDGRAI